MSSAAPGLRPRQQQILGMRMKVPAQPACLDEGSAFSEAYELGRHLGNGSFGNVWACRNRGTGEELAAKIVPKAALGTEARAAMKREISVLESLRGQHPGVVQMKEALESASSDQVVMEMCKGGELFSLLSMRGRLPERSARLVFCQLASALAMCHSKGVIHRDIKPENILFDRPAACLYHPASSTNPVAPPVQAKLVDFGLACVLIPGETTSGCTGSRYYTAPEMLLGKRYGRRVDVWSLGVVLATMLTGKLPFSGKGPRDSEGLKKAIIKAKLQFSQPAWQGVSREARDLVSRMLQAEPQHRPRASELLAHPWCAKAREGMAAVTGSATVPGPVCQAADMANLAAAERTTTCTSIASLSSEFGAPSVTDLGLESPRTLTSGDLTRAPSLRGDGALCGESMAASHVAEEGEGKGKIEGCYLVQEELGVVLQRTEAASKFSAGQPCLEAGGVFREGLSAAGPIEVSSEPEQCEARETIRQEQLQQQPMPTESKKGMQITGIMRWLQHRKCGMHTG